MYLTHNIGSASALPIIKKAGVNEYALGIDTICFFFQHIMLFHYAVFFAQIMLKNMLFALHYAKLF